MIPKSFLRFFHKFLRRFRSWRTKRRQKRVVEVLAPDEIVEQSEKVRKKFVRKFGLKE